jgi:hypothetical protein
MRTQGIFPLSVKDHSVLGLIAKAFAASAAVNSKAYEWGFIGCSA